MKFHVIWEHKKKKDKNNSRNSVHLTDEFISLHSGWYEASWCLECFLVLKKMYPSGYFPFSLPSDCVYGIILDFWKHCRELLMFQFFKIIILKKICRLNLMLNLKATYKEWPFFKMLVIFQYIPKEDSTSLETNLQSFLKLSHWLSPHWLMDFHARTYSGYCWFRGCCS